MRKKWKYYIDRMLTFALIGILLPLFITIICQRMRLEEVIYGTYDAITETAEREGGEELEEQLPFILAKEIRADAEDAALMAQCVIARTTLYDAAARGEEQPAAFSEEELRQALGETYEKTMERLEMCVEETSGQVLSWNGGYAYAAYHAISAGSTRDMSRSAEAAVPYLPAVECPADLTAEGTLSVIYCEETDILKRCGEHFAEADVSAVSEIQVTERDAAGYVQQVMLGEYVCTGEAFREAMGWNSACFTITQMGENVRIVTRGLGHGYGLSQNEARAMAQEGTSYEEILQYFFPGTTLVTADQIK